MATHETSPAKQDDRPWIAEPADDGFYRVVNNLSVVIAEKCVKEEAALFAAAPELGDALDALLAVTLDEDVAQGIELTDKEERAREMALAALDKAYGQAS